MHALRALHEAEEARSTIRPTVITEYLEARQSDLEKWRKHLIDLPYLRTLHDALEHLGLPFETSSPERMGKASSVVR